MQHSTQKQILVFLFLVLSVLGFGQSRSTFYADKDTVAEQEIEKLEYLLAALIEKGDVDTYAGYLTDDYVRIAANGAISTKDQILDGLRKNKGKTQVTMMPHDLQVRIYGTTAILRGTLDLETKNGDLVTKRRSLITKVFIKRDGKWYMASLQGTPLQ
jgi:ketosteroid isomerase-like protein